MLTIYKASAGSGKTFTLAYEYIKLVLGVKDKTTGKYRLNKNAREAHRSILAITFTNKATDEMKRRIVKELAILARVPSTINEIAKEKGCDPQEVKSDYADRLAKLFECSDEELVIAADKALNQLLFDYTFFNISTIDAFFQTILRTFAYEADLVGNYDVEIDDTYAISTGVNEMLNEINYGSTTSSRQLAKWLKRYMMQKLNDGQGFNMFNRNSSFHTELLKFITNLCDENFKLNADRIIEYLQDQNRIALFEEKLVEKLSIKKNLIKQYASFCLNTLNNEDIPLEAVERYTASTITAWHDGNLKNPSDTVIKVISGEKPLFKSTYTKKTPISEQISILIRDRLQPILRLLEELKFIGIVRKNLYGLGLLGDVLRFVKEYRKENNLILLSDTNDLLRRIISEDDTPFIYERVGVRLHNFLIDEFQDTSKLQWDNLSPLVSESLSTDNDNLIIGDEKQCIYRFRNSDPSLLRLQVKERFPNNSTERGIDINDNTNWRSSADIVRFNNTVFSALSEVLKVKDEYKNTTQLISPRHRDHRGYVKFTRHEGKSKEVNEASLSLMAEDIKRQLEAGYEPRDIAVLVNRRQEAATAATYLLNLAKENYFGDQKIDIISDEALRVDSSPMVRLLLSVLRVMAMPDNSTSPKRSSAREIVRVHNRFEYFVNKGDDANKALRKALGQEDPIEELAQKSGEMTCVSLPSLVERIIMTYIPDDALRQENAYISAFQDIVVDYCSRGSQDVHSFLRWWDKSGCATCLQSSDLNAINIMTIHKSKGLEFKCVHIPFANWEMTKEKDLEWFANPKFQGIDKDIIPPLLPLKSTKELINTQFEEQYRKNRDAEIVDVLNMTYVAFTRAVDELSVSYAYSDKSNSKSDTDQNAKKKVGYYLDKSFQEATKEYCEGLLARLPDIARECDIYTDLNIHNDNGTLVIGHPTTRERAEKRESKDFMPPYFSFDGKNVWEMARIEDISEPNEARERGIFLHNVMSRIRTPKDIEIAVRRQAYRQYLPETKIQETITYIEKIIADERTYRWFNDFKRVLCERPILCGSDKEMRPDRVVWTADGNVEVIDYKFGEEHPDDYAEQVSKYMTALSDAGYQNVKGYLWYPNTSTIIEIKQKQ